MKRRSTISGAIAVVASLVLAGSALAAFAGANNGSFENGSYVDGGGGYQTLNVGATALTGWTISAGSVDWIGSFWTSQNGARSVDLSGVDAGAISQHLLTTIGKTYSVTFYLAGNPAGTPAVKNLTVSATGATSASYTFDTTGHSTTSMGWTLKEYAFSATSADTLLTFTSLTTTSAGPALDNIVVTETAASSSTSGPGAACKLGAWKTMTDKAGHQFRNQGDCVSYYATKFKNTGAGAR